MMLSFFIVIALLCQAIDGKVSSLHLEASHALKSRPHTFHASPEHFHQSMMAFTHKISDPSNNLRSARHPFMLKLSDSCDALCHETLRSSVGHGRYELISSTIAIISTTHDHLTALQAAHPGHLQEFVPMHPDMKIVSALREMAIEPMKCIQNGVNPGGSLLITMHHLDPAQWEAASTWVTSLSNKYNGVITVTGAPVARAEHVYLVVKTSDCQLLPDLAAAFAHRGEVVLVEHKQPMSTCNRWAKGLVDVGNAHYTPLIANNFTGAEEIVGIADTGLDMMNCYLYDPLVPTPYSYDITGPLLVNTSHRKVIQYIAYQDDLENSEGHGSHVAGILAGLAYENYGDFQRFNGMSYNAKIAFFDITAGEAKDVQPPSDLNSQLFELQYQAGARIFSNSWGTKGENGYDTNAHNVDLFMRNHPDALVLFAAGNTGNFTTTRNRVYAPATAKNCVAVGAASNDHESWQAISDSTHVMPADAVGMDGVAFFSSPGPTEDNRLKPDVMAPGYFVQSALGTNTSTEYFCDIHGLSADPRAGTSMATPVVSGYAIKIRQYFLQGYYPSGFQNISAGFVPSGALIKAMLIASAVPMQYFVFSPSSYSALPGGYPSVLQGYGRVQMSNVLNLNASASTDPLSLFIIGSANKSYPYYTEFLGTGGTRSYSFNTDRIMNVRIVLCYTDAAGSANSASPMVNKLTLSLTGTDGTSKAPYPFESFDLSNTQVIDVTSKATFTTWTVKVTATSISSSPQPFALVAVGEISYYDLGESNEVDRTYTYTSKGMTEGAKIAVGLLVVALVSLMLLVVYVRRISIARNTILLDPANYANESLYNFEVEEEMDAPPPKKSLFSSVFGSAPSPGPSTGSAPSTPKSSKKKLKKNP